MDKHNSDDLLFKSQMLISKFRKQREASMKKQDFHLNKFHKRTTFSSQNYSKPIEFNRFQSIDNFNSPPKFEVRKLHSKEKDEDALSFDSSNGWSEGEDSELKKYSVKLNEINSSRIPDDDIVTPLTAVTPTVKSSRKYMSIATEVNKITGRNELSGENGDNDSEDIIMTIDENSRITNAMKLLDEEKQIEQEIVDQMHLIDQLNRQIQDLQYKSEVEIQKLELMKEKKSKLATGRLNIFNDLTKDLNNQLYHDRPIQNNNLLDTCNHNSSHNEGVTQLPKQHIYPAMQPNNNLDLDPGKIKEIINKVVYNELSSTEDETEDLSVIIDDMRVFHNGKYFSKHNTAPSNHSAHCDYINSNNEAVLSDVLSANECNVPPTEYLSNPTELPPPCKPNAGKYNIQKKPPNPNQHRLKCAHSYDNLAQNRKSSNISRRKYNRSPATSEIARINHYSEETSDTL